MHEYAEMGCVETWYATIRAKDVLKALTPRTRRGAEQILSKAKRQTSVQVLEKMTDLVDDQHRIVEHPPLIVRETRTSSGRPITEAIDEALSTYVESLAWDRQQLIARYRLLDVVRKVVGVGSVGLQCWIALLQGHREGDPLFLQLKEAQESALQPYVPKVPAFRTEGHRIVVGQRLIQGSPDIFLGWGSVAGIDFYVRQLRDMKGGVELEPDEIDLPSFDEYCALCGWALALAHAKSGDAASIAGYAGKGDALDDALARFAVAYAEQTDLDYDALAAAAKSGRIAVSKE
jgi:uncharacterized protein (DUF2252 family)